MSPEQAHEIMLDWGCAKPDLDPSEALRRKPGQEKDRKRLAHMWSLAWEGQDDKLLIELKKDPKLCRAWGAYQAGLGVELALTRASPLAQLAADHCCFESAWYCVEQGADPRWRDSEGHDMWLAASLGVGVNASHRLLDHWDPKELDRQRRSFLSKLISTEQGAQAAASAMSLRGLALSARQQVSFDALAMALRLENLSKRGLGDLDESEIQSIQQAYAIENGRPFLSPRVWTRSLSRTLLDHHGPASAEAALIAALEKERPLMSRAKFGQIKSLAARRSESIRNAIRAMEERSELEKIKAPKAALKPKASPRI